MTRAELERHLATGEGATIGEYFILPVPAKKGKRGILQKAPCYYVSTDLRNGFEQEFTTLDEVLACDPGVGKTLAEMLKDVTCLRFPLADKR